jgi:peptidoglycan/LPS O-acetylase OafA/YrhL
MRFVAASGVILSHHFPISGFEEPHAFGISVGSVSVYIFFLMSGFLICSSILVRPDFYRFISARVLRIIPNLVFVLIVTSIITLVTYSNYGNWFGHARYVVQNLVMLVRGGVYYDVAGVFDNRPLHAINGSLWSLPYEVWCYFILFAILNTSKNYRKTGIIIALILCVLMGLFVNLRIPGTAIDLHYLGSLGFWFFAGAAFALFLSRIPLLSLATFSWFGKWGDPSYGMYIMAWPVQQYCAIAIQDFWLSILASFLITTALGFATWHLFERTALTKVDTLASWLRQLFRSNAP